MNTSTVISSIAGALLMALAVIPGRPWIALAYHSLSYPVTLCGEAANVVIDGSTAFESLADRGFVVIDTPSGRVLSVVGPPAGGDKVPRKGGPGITQSDLLVINKTDLAPHVGADLPVMERDATRMRSGGPVVFAQATQDVGIDAVVDHILATSR